MTSADLIEYRERSTVDDQVLSTLHRGAFWSSGSRDTVVVPWRSRLERWSISWVAAYAGDQLVGFVNVAGDGGVHAFLLDPVVDPQHRHRGIGAELVRRAAAAARTAAATGCTSTTSPTSRTSTSAPAASARPPPGC